MKLDDIIAMWAQDSKVDQSEIGEELERTYQLHAKYLDLLQKEKLKKKGLEYEYKRKKLEAFEEYTQGPPQGSSRKLPAIGRVAPSLATMYIDADKQIQELSAAIDMCDAKIDVLSGAVNMITYRNNTLSTTLEWVKWTGGQ
jgi:hypothetical protein